MQDSKMSMFKERKIMQGQVQNCPVLIVLQELLTILQCTGQNVCVPKSQCRSYGNSGKGEV